MKRHVRWNWQLEAWIEGDSAGWRYGELGWFCWPIGLLIAGHFKRIELELVDAGLGDGTG